MKGGHCVQIDYQIYLDGDERMTGMTSELSLTLNFITITGRSTKDTLINTTTAPMASFTLVTVAIFKFALPRALKRDNRSVRQCCVLPEIVMDLLCA